MRISSKARRPLPDLVGWATDLAHQLGQAGVTDVADLELRFKPLIGNKPANLLTPGGDPIEAIRVNGKGERAYCLVKLRDLRAEGEA